MRRRDENVPKSLTQKKLAGIRPLLSHAARPSGLACVDDLNAAAATVELYVAVDQRVERKVTTLTNPSAGVEAVADLTDEDISGSYFLATESLHAATLAV